MIPNIPPHYDELELKIVDSMEKGASQFINLLFSAFLGVGLTLLVSLPFMKYLKIYEILAIALVTTSFVFILRYAIQPFKLEKSLYGLILLDIAKGRVLPPFTDWNYIQSFAYHIYQKHKCSGKISSNFLKIATDLEHFQEDGKQSEKIKRVNNFLTRILVSAVLHVLTSKIHNESQILFWKIKSLNKKLSLITLSWKDIFVKQNGETDAIISILSEDLLRKNVLLPENLLLKVFVSSSESSKITLKGFGWILHLEIIPLNFYSFPHILLGPLSVLYGVCITKNRRIYERYTGYLRCFSYIIKLKLHGSALLGLLWLFPQRRKRVKLFCSFFSRISTEIIASFDWNFSKMLTEKLSPPYYWALVTIEDMLKDLKEDCAKSKN